jgi:hypothetical protein
MRNCVLVRIRQRLPDAADSPLWAASEPLVGPRRRDFANDGSVAKSRINPLSQTDKSATNCCFLALVFCVREPNPRFQLAVRRDHDGPVMCWRASRVAFIRNRNEHVVAIAERQRIILKQLMMGEMLLGDLVLGNAQEHDDRAAERASIALDVGPKATGD